MEEVGGTEATTQGPRVLGVGLGSPRTEHQKFWLQTTRLVLPQTHAYVVLSALVPYWVSQVFLQRYQMRAYF